MAQIRHSSHAGLDSADTAPVVSWLFTRNGQALTCQVDQMDVRDAGSSYAVAVVPHWDIAQAVVEDVPTPASALQRHAQIALMLREAGWCVARRSA